MNNQYQIEKQLIELIGSYVLNNCKRSRPYAGKGSGAKFCRCRAIAVCR